GGPATIGGASPDPAPATPAAASILRPVPRRAHQRPTVTPPRASDAVPPPLNPGEMTRKERLRAILDELRGWQFQGTVERFLTPADPYRPADWLEVTALEPYLLTLQADASCWE